MMSRETCVQLGADAVLHRAFTQDGLIDPADIASMAVYLASDVARSVVGQFIGVDGDGLLMV